MPKFTATSPIKHDGKRYSVGAPIDLTKAEADKLPAGTVEAAGAEQAARKAAAERLAAEQAEADRLAAEQAEAERLAAERQSDNPGLPQG